MQRYNIFRDQSIALANSLIIKLDSIAQEMNLTITENGGVVSDNRATWRYYLHLAGQRHPIDKPIMIKSLDTQELIELTIANLSRHKKTANVYRTNPSYIFQLMLDNLDYKVYIDGVFWPTPLEVSTTVPDCTILHYDQALVESQEQSLIPNLESKIKAMHVRYMADGWKVHNDAFTLSFYNIMFPMLVPTIMELRAKAQHTTETHSYYVTEFLASHQELHEFIPYLNTAQLFTLYRNIRYWERNTGKQDIFDWLVDTFLTGWGMPAVTYRVSQQVQNPSTGLDKDITPLPVGYADTLNYKERDSGRDLNLIATADIIHKEVKLAYNNVPYEDDYLTDLDNRLGLTRYPDQPTKVVEVTAIDPEAIERFEYMHGLFNEWLHLVALGRYNIYHEILNPTNGETLKLTSKEIVALFLYAAYKGFSDVTLETIPTFNIFGVQLKRWVNVDEITNLVQPEYEGHLDSLIEYYADTQYEVYNNIASPDELYDAADTLISRKRMRYQYSYNRRRLDSRRAGIHLFSYFYRDYKFDLGLPYRNYDEFFKRFGFDNYKIISNETWVDIASDAFNAATNTETRSTVSQAEIQRAMVRLLSKLSSYTVHFAARMTSDSFDVFDPILPVLGPIKTKGAGSVNIIDATTDIIDTHTTKRYKVNKTLQNGPVLVKADIPLNLQFKMSIYPAIQVKVIVNHHIDISEPTTDVKYFPPDEPRPVVKIDLASYRVEKQLDGFNQPTK